MAGRLAIPASRCYSGRGFRARGAKGSNVRRVYRHEVEVGQAALDENGHVNNVQYVQWMQAAAVLHAEAVGCTKAVKALGATWVARSHWIEFLRPGLAGDRIAVLTWVSNFRKVRSLRKYRFVRLADKALLARAQTDWVLVDAARGRPRAIPKSICELFEVVPEAEEPQIGLSAARGTSTSRKA